MTCHHPSNTFVSELALKVNDLERVLTFYQDVIGFQILEKSKEKASLTADGKTKLLTLEQLENGQPKQKNTTGLYHFALLLPNRADLARVIIHLAEKNIQLGAADHLVSEAVYLSDPEGNGIEIYIDRPEDTWTWQNGEVKMVTDPLNIEDLLKEAGEKTWQGLPADTVMGHIHLHVANLDETRIFYQDGLGFEVVLHFGNQALFMSTGKYHHHIGLNTWAGVGAPQSEESSVGLKQFTLAYPTVEARNQAVNQLKQLKAHIEETDNAVYTEDPSGNRIELSVQ